MQSRDNFYTSQTLSWCETTPICISSVYPISTCTFTHATRYARRRESLFQNGPERVCMSYVREMQCLCSSEPTIHLLNTVFTPRYPKLSHGWTGVTTLTQSAFCGMLLLSAPSKRDSPPPTFAWFKFTTSWKALKRFCKVSFQAPVPPTY